jgi:hypothetical protein
MQFSGADASWGKNQARVQWEFWGLISHTGFRECSSVELLPPRGLGGHLACLLVPSITCGAARDMGPAYTGVLFSLEFQGEGSRSLLWGVRG